MSSRVALNPGDRRGGLVILERIGLCENKRQGYLWRCRCDCGVVVLRRTEDLNYGRAVSCGCAAVRAQKTFAEQARDRATARAARRGWGRRWTKATVPTFYILEDTDQ